VEALVNLGAADGGCVSRDIRAPGPMNYVDELNCLTAAGFPTVAVEGDERQFPFWRERYGNRSDVVLLLETASAATIRGKIDDALLQLGSPQRIVLKIDLDSDDCEYLEALVDLDPLVVYLESHSYTAGNIPPDIAVRQRSQASADIAPPVFADELTGEAIQYLDDERGDPSCSVGAMLESLGDRYRLLQIEEPQNDVVFLRADVAEFFPFTRHGAGEIWRRYVDCNPWISVGRRFVASETCDIRGFSDPSASLELRAAFVRICFRVAIDWLRGGRSNYTVTKAKPTAAQKDLKSGAESED